MSCYFGHSPQDFKLWKAFFLTQMGDVMPLEF